MLPVPRLADRGEIRRADAVRALLASLMVRFNAVTA
jgi:hypothetical protein